MSEQQDQPADPPPPYAAPPGWQPPPPYGQPPPGGWPPPPYGQPPYGQPPYGQPTYGQVPYGAVPGYPPAYGYRPPPSVNGFAIASLACAIVLFWLFGVGGLLGVIFGIIGLRQCRANHERGSGLAIAGIVIGSIVLLLWVIGGIVAAVDDGSSSNDSGFNATPTSVISAGR